MDETKVKVRGEWLYLWAAIDRNTSEVLHTWVFQGRSAFEVLRFLRRVLGVRGPAGGVRGPSTLVPMGLWIGWVCPGSIGPSDPGTPSSSGSGS